MNETKEQREAMEELMDAVSHLSSVGTGLWLAGAGEYPEGSRQAHPRLVEARRRQKAAYTAVVAAFLGEPNE